MRLYQKVRADVKVLAVDEPVTFLSGVVKQDVTVADHHSVAKVVLWESNIGKLQEHSSYTLKDFVIHEYACSRFLGFSQDGSEIHPLPDIGVIQQLDWGEDGLEELCDARIIAIMQLDVHRGCLRCRAHVQPEQPPYGRCSKLECQMMQCYEECAEQITAKVMFKKDSWNTLTLTAFGETFKKLAHVDEEAPVSEVDLMSAPPEVISKCCFQGNCTYL